MHRKLEEGGECRRGTRRRFKVRTNGPGANSATGKSGGRFEDKGQVSGLTIYLEHVLRHGEGNTNLDSLERVAYAGSVLEKRRWISRSSATFSKQPYRAHCCRAGALAQDKVEALQRMSSSRWNDARINLPGRLLALTRSNWDGEPNKQQTPIKVLRRKFGMFDNCNGTQNPTLGMGLKSDRANPRRRPAPPASVGGNFWTDALG